jgi:putative hydrolase of the HAD superfamily
MIKAILFDYDGVMTPDKTGSYTICKYISKVTGVDFEKLSGIYRSFNNDLLYGKTVHEKIWREFCSRLGISIDIRHLYDSFENTPVNKPVFDLVKNLKLNYKTGLITDNKKDRIDHILRKQKLDELFDVISISADVGSGKDHAEIFNKTTTALDVKNEECVFIDNQEKNLIIPDKLGMKTVFYDHEKNDAIELKSKLAGFGVLS